VGNLARAPISATERAGVLRAIELAGRGAGTVLPNPVVGCVLLAPDGRTVGEGWHEQAGGPHAEVVALADAGERAAGATALVTLEPCNHAGRTGPCSEALIAAGIARVVVAVRDPWPTAAGGIERLRAGGLDVVDLSADPGPADPGSAELLAAAEDVNRVWLTTVRAGRPFVTWKSAITVDGRVAAADGTSRWISSAESRAEVHDLRRRVDTMMVGVGTVLADDPQLTARDADGRPAGRQPLRVVIDSYGRTPDTARVLDDLAETLVCTAAEYPRTDNRVDVAAVLTSLYERGRRHVLLEGGPRLTASMLDAGLVDEVLLYLAPLALGAGRPALADGAVATLADAHRLELRSLRRVGPDVVLRYAVRG